MARATKTGRRKLLDVARDHQDALQAAGLPVAALERFERALRGLESKAPSPSAQVLANEILRETVEIQAAIRKEFPGAAEVQAVFRAGDPGQPRDAPETLALGRWMVKEAEASARSLIEYAINAATLKHLASLCDHLEKELGGADPEGDAAALERQIRGVAKQVFDGKPELAQFEARSRTPQPGCAS